MSELRTQQAPARWKLWVGVALFVSLTLSFLVLTQESAPVPPKSSAVQSVTEVRVVGDAQGLRRSLPFSPAPKDPQGTSTRLRFEVMLEDIVLSMRPSLYVPHFAQAMEITVNGQANPTDLPIGARAYNWNRPALVRLDNRHLRVGENVVEIQLSSTSPFSQVYLSRMMVGPYDALAPVWRARMAARVDVLQLLNTILFWLSSAMGILFLLRPKERQFGWFAAGITFTALYNLNFLVAQPPVPIAWWQSLLLVSLGLGMVCLFKASASSGAGRTHWFGRGIDRVFLAGAVGLIALYGLHDVLSAAGALSRERTQLLSYGLYTIVVCQAWFVLVKFAGALDRLETINADLDVRVQAREAELAALHARQVEDARDRAKAAERERLMQDMHDGVGGRIMSAISLLEQEEIGVKGARDELRTCMEDVRLIVESLDNDAGDLNAALADFRFQAAPRLQRQGIIMRWQVEALNTDVPPEHVLHILRILQETVTNVLRHAQATTIFVSAQQQGGTTVIEVRDDGRGLPDEGARSSGRGLGNIRKRAVAIGAEAIWHSDASGTSLRLSVAGNS
ncbi:sensor histidine kinase [Shimia sp. MIT1388]|uniref:sensor histidine kinase n=1 Tax=Shimia sp. MIT1388 TaxID=3096992 RepID=UPI00399B7CBC